MRRGCALSPEQSEKRLAEMSDVCRDALREVGETLSGLRGFVEAVSESEECCSPKLDSVIQRLSELEEVVATTADNLPKVLSEKTPSENITRLYPSRKSEG